MTDPTSSPTNAADDPTLAMRRRRDRYVASRLRGQTVSTFSDGLIWVALATGGLWYAQREGWPHTVAAAVGAVAVAVLAALPQLHDWLRWRRDRSQPLSESELDQLAVTAIAGHEDPARAKPWRRETDHQ